MRIPLALQTDDVASATATLTRYFGGSNPADQYTGASFDSWDSTGTRDHDVNIFTADDLVAIGFLSVNAGPVAARTILRDRRTEFSELLARIGPDRDLADVDDEIDKTWPAWSLETQLRAVPGVGQTIASKLIARKRPRLYPIYDTVVAEVLGTKTAHLVPIRDELRRNQGSSYLRVR